MNKVELLGRLTKDPDVQRTQQGMAVARFTLAVNRMRKDGGADFIACKAFGKTAELLEQYTRKGDQLCLCGRIETGSYEKEGRKVYTTEVVSDEIHFVGGKRDESKPAEKKDDFQPADEGIPFELPF